MIWNALGIEMAAAKKAAEANLFLKNTTFIESEAKVFKYLVQYDLFYSYGNDVITEDQIKNSDENSAGGIGSKFLYEYHQQFMNGNVPLEIYQQIIREFYNWALEHRQLKGYRKGGVIDKVPDALNSTDTDIWDTRPLTDEEKCTNCV